MILLNYKKKILKLIIWETLLFTPSFPFFCIQKQWAIARQKYTNCPGMCNYFDYTVLYFFYNLFSSEFSLDPLIDIRSEW